MESLGYAASLAMGITLGVMGGGGSILTVPIMVYLFRLPPSLATGYSLFVVGLTALAGALMALRRREIDFRSGLSFALPSMIGVNVSRALILPQLPDVIFEIGSFSLRKEVLIMMTFAVLMLVAATSMIKKRKEVQLEASRSLLKTLRISAQGLSVGLIAGFVGAGGGFLIIPALVLLTGLPMRLAVGTSLAIIAFQSLVGFVGDVFRGELVDWPLLFSVAVTAVLGIVLGSSMAHKIKEQKLKKAFGWFVLLMGAIILVEQSFQLGPK